MSPEFVPLTDEKPGTIAVLLRTAYTSLLASDNRWALEQAKWEEYDRDVFAYRDVVGACLFLTRVGGRIAGFASWDPRQQPSYGIIGHNCILPEFRGHGLGKQQIQEVLRRFRLLGIQTARATTCDHPFFIPAQRMYLACGFREMRRQHLREDRNRVMIVHEIDIQRLEMRVTLSGSQT